MLTSTSDLPQQRVSNNYFFNKKNHSQSTYITMEEDNSTHTNEDSTREPTKEEQKNALFAVLDAADEDQERILRLRVLRQSTKSVKLDVSDKEMLDKIASDLKEIKALPLALFAQFKSIRERYLTEVNNKYTLKHNLMTIMCGGTIAGMPSESKGITKDSSYWKNLIFILQRDGDEEEFTQNESNKLREIEQLEYTQRDVFFKLSNSIEAAINNINELVKHKDEEINTVKEAVLGIEEKFPYCTCCETFHEPKSDLHSNSKQLEPVWFGEE